MGRDDQHINLHLNRTRKTTIEGKRPHEFGNNPRIRHFRIIGSKCFAHLPSQRMKQIDKKATKGYLVGYDTEERYRIFVNQNNRIILSRDIKFNENISDCEDIEDKSSPSEEQVQLRCHDIKRLVPEDAEQDEELDPLNRTFRSDHIEEQNVESEVEQEDEFEECLEDKNELVCDDEPISKRLRSRNANVFHYSEHKDFVMVAHDFVSKLESPTTYIETMRSSEKVFWKRAMNSEIESLKENQTWEIVSLPKGSKPLPSKWVYKIKTNPDESIDKYKARLVIKDWYSNNEKVLITTKLFVQ